MPGILSEILADLRVGDATREDQQWAADVIELRGKKIAEFEAALAKLMQSAVDHIIASHPNNLDALAAMHEAERILTQPK